QVWCDNTDCSQVGLYGGESLGSIVNYTWEIDGNEVANGATDTSTILDMASEAGNFLEATLTVEDAGGSTSSTQLLVGNMGSINTLTPIQAIVVMPPPGACSSPTPVTNIGGCVTNLTSVNMQAWDYIAGNPNPSLRKNGMTVFEFAGTGSFTTPGFVQYAAWYQTGNPVNFYKMDPTQYAIQGANFTANVVDPIIGQPAPAPTSYTPHVSMWVDVEATGTDFIYAHTPQGNGETQQAPYYLYASCNSKGNLFFEFKPTQ
ncbi:MAG: hypothetical protein ACI8RZ_000941, partial [Myxococcota bacterium]